MSRESSPQRRRQSVPPVPSVAWDRLLSMGDRLRRARKRSPLATCCSCGLFDRPAANHHPVGIDALKARVNACWPLATARARRPHHGRDRNAGTGPPWTPEDVLTLKEALDCQQPISKRICGNLRHLWIKKAPRTTTGRRGGWRSMAGGGGDSPGLEKSQKSVFLRAGGLLVGGCVA